MRSLPLESEYMFETYKQLTISMTDNAEPIWEVFDLLTILRATKRDLFANFSASKVKFVPTDNFSPFKISN